MVKHDDMIARFVERIVSGSERSIAGEVVTLDELMKRRTEMAREAAQALKEGKDDEVPLELARLTAAIRYLRHREAHGA